MEDKILKTLVEDELAFQPSIDAVDIGVIVDRGIVRLTGHVTNYAQKSAAENAVKRVKGVRGYVEDLEVRPFENPQSDESIAARVANLIDWDVTLPKGAIKVKVEGGVVALSGDVEWAYQRAGAETGVRRLPGVRALVNTITVKPRISAGDIKRRIEQALERQAEVEAGHISVAVDGGQVKLAGHVRAWYERDIIERAAWSAPGVQAVDDRVTIGV
jgi:osmotically-inducible protein OsmY